jgi:lipopolysaccharide transport system ATP-binding protein
MVVYPKHGAEIMAPRILTVEGEQVNLLRRGMEYQYVFDVRFDESGENIRYGMLIKTPDGREIGGLASSPRGEGMRAAAGMEHRQCFRFRCNLLPGTYFINAGVVGPEGQYWHRIIDAVMFTVLPEPESCGSGIIDISATNC